MSLNPDEDFDVRVARSSDSFCLPTQGREERLHLYRWIEGEEKYVAGKFDDQRDRHDESMRSCDLEDFWIRQVVQYYDRARTFLGVASNLEGEERRILEMKAQQAMAKAMMTAKGMVESSIRVFGALPKPGVTSGEIEVWE